MIQFDILTLFPGMFTGPFTESILKRAQDAGHLTINLHNIRDFATDRHKSVDDYPFGGGAGMVFRPDVVYAALEHVLGEASPHPRAQRAPASPSRGEGETGSSPGSPPEQAQYAGHDQLNSSTQATELLPSPLEGEGSGVRGSSRPPVIYLTPDGEVLTQRIAQELAAYPRLVLLCGHYEGVDERVRACCVDREISIGDYVVTGGELAAMVLVDAVARLRPGVLAEESTAEESHADGLLEYPHYTRPALWHDEKVPDVLVSGHHARVAAWRHEQRLLRTLQRRPDLLSQARLSDKDRRFLAQHGWLEPSPGDRSA